MFGDGAKLMEFSMSANGVLAGLAILLADGNGRGGGDLNSDNPIIGSWAGDNIVVAGDYADTGKWVKDPNQTLYSMAYTDGEDISLKVIDALCDDTYFFQEFRKNRAGWAGSEVLELVEKKMKEKGLKPIEKWKVPSSKDVTILYEVTNDNGDWDCTCPSFAYNNGKDCKHIKDIKN